MLHEHFNLLLVKELCLKHDFFVLRRIYVVLRRIYALSYFIGFFLGGGEGS